MLEILIRYERINLNKRETGYCFQSAVSGPHNPHFAFNSVLLHEQRKEHSELRRRCRVLLNTDACAVEAKCLLAFKHFFEEVCSKLISRWMTIQKRRFRRSCCMSQPMPG